MSAARTRRGVERCPLLRTAAASNTQKGDELDKNEAGRGEHVTLRQACYVTLRQAAVRLNKTLENIRVDSSQQSGEQGTSLWRV